MGFVCSLTRRFSTSRSNEYSSWFLSSCVVESRALKVVCFLFSKTLSTCKHVSSLLGRIEVENVNSEDVRNIF